jgi:hypothetical protein
VKAENTVIPRATGADLPGIVELWAEFMDFHAVRAPYFTTSISGQESFAVYLAERRRTESNIVLVAEAAGCPGGLASPASFRAGRL